MLGIDVSNAQGFFDWNAAKAAGVSFAFVKASERTDFLDDQLDRNRDEAARVGIPVGLYHFARPDLGFGPITEARWFVRCVGSLRQNELRPMLDLEMGKPTGNWTTAFLKEVERLLGVRPGWYSYPDFILKMETTAGFDDLRKYWPLWLAQYGPNDGQRHELLFSNAYRVICHQYTSKGQLPGLPQLDLNWCEDRNLLRERGDYRLWSDWISDGAEEAQRPLGVAGTIPQRFKDEALAESASITRLLLPLQSEIEHLAADVTTYKNLSAELVSERDGLVGKIAAAVKTLQGGT